MSKTTELVERLRELPRDTHKATLEIYDLCVEASYKIEELAARLFDFRFDGYAKAQGAEAVLPDTIQSIENWLKEEMTG